MYRACSATLRHAHLNRKSQAEGCFALVKRFRSTQKQRNPSRQWDSSSSSSNPLRRTSSPPQFYKPQEPDFLANTTLDSRLFLAKFAQKWARLPMVIDRFTNFGLPKLEVTALLDTFGHVARKGRLSDNPREYEKYQVGRLDRRAVPAGGLVPPADVALSNIFLLWATDPKTQLPSNVQHDSIAQLIKVMDAAALHFPPDVYAKARRLKRHFIMHVGPTNSGKTHHALRALAAASNGCYAGPLRLLAYEIFERLNMGDIQPLGADDVEETPVSSDQSSTSHRRGNPAWRRACNMVTGEEVKIVDDQAPLMSCTVEMVYLSAEYEVAVIDEIQMIANPQRGFAWTNAVLGMYATEIHLCGEDTAVPIIRELLKQTGDTLEIRNYERLTPLIPAKESINSDWKNVEKGDCVVAFSRKDIFAIKRKIEHKAGMRCAVVYGKLPPEIRSEQAALFNDPTSGYDVLVGSDAIGMGLNLKIRRIVFSRVTKWDGTREVPLSTSSLKQIAGRAGRFGLERDSDQKAGGSVTTFHSHELPSIYHGLKQPNTLVMSARLSPSPASFETVAHSLHAHANIRTIFDAHMFASLVPPLYQYHEVRLDALSEFLENAIPSPQPKLDDAEQPSTSLALPEAPSRLTLSEKLLVAIAPVPWRDKQLLPVIAALLNQMQTELSVDFDFACSRLNLMEKLQEVEHLMSTEELSDDELHSLRTSLEMLENFHKVIVWYVWMGFRVPVAFADVPHVQETKLRVEVAMEWILESISRHELGLEHGKKRTSKPQLDYITPRTREKVVVMNNIPVARGKQSQKPTWFNKVGNYREKEWFEELDDPKVSPPSGQVKKVPPS